MDVNGHSQSQVSDLASEGECDSAATTDPPSRRATNRVSNASSNQGSSPAAVPLVERRSESSSNPSTDAEISEKASIDDDGLGERKFNLKDLLFSGPKLSRTSKRESPPVREPLESDKYTLSNKYGIPDKLIGKGTASVIRLAHKWSGSSERLYAVKEFRKRQNHETQREYEAKIYAEYCISSTLYHKNIIETIDLMRDENERWSIVMELCTGGDLDAAINRGGMTSSEVECTFKQLLNGISYLHGQGVAHGDIKPENLLFDSRSRLKIVDYGNATVFRLPWDSSVYLQSGHRGNNPYVAPEAYLERLYDMRLVDIWACGIIYCFMLFQEPWLVAQPSDQLYAVHAAACASPPSSQWDFPPAIDNLWPRACRTLIRRMLEPDPVTRITAGEALSHEWVQGIEICHSVSDPTHDHDHVAEFSNRSPEKLYLKDDRPLKVDEKAFQKSLGSLAGNREVQDVLVQSLRTSSPKVVLAGCELTCVPSASISFLAHVQYIDLSKNDLGRVNVTEFHAFGKMKKLRALRMRNCNLREFPQIADLKDCYLDVKGNPLIPLPMQEALRSYYGDHIEFDDRQMQINCFKDMQLRDWVNEPSISPQTQEQRRQALEDIENYLLNTLPGKVPLVEFSLEGRAVGRLPFGLLDVVTTATLIHVSVASCQLIGAVDLPGLCHACKLKTLDISDNELTDDQDFSALSGCQALKKISAEQNPISFLPNGIDRLPANVTLHLDEHMLANSAKVEASVFNGLCAIGKHAFIEIGGETSSRITRIARMEAHTRNIEEVNRKIEKLREQEKLLPGELKSMEERWNTLQEMLQKQEDANLIHTHIALYGSPEMQRYYRYFHAFGSTLLHGSHALRNVSIRPNLRADTGSTTPRTAASLLAQAATAIGSHIPAAGLPMVAFGKGLEFAIQFIEQRDFHKINNKVASFLEREEIDTFIHGLSRAAAWSMEEMWQREKLLISCKLRMPEGKNHKGSVNAFLGKAVRVSRDVLHNAIKSSNEELAYRAAAAKGTATTSKDEFMEQQRASRDVCSLLIGMAYGKPWEGRSEPEIRELPLEEKLHDGLAWFSSGKHRSEHPAPEDVVKNKPHLLVVDRSMDEKVNDLTKHLMLGMLDNTQTIAEQRRQIQEHRSHIDHLIGTLKKEKDKRRKLIRALKQMPGFKQLYSSDSESETEGHAPPTQSLSPPPAIRFSKAVATMNVAEENSKHDSPREEHLTPAEQVKAEYLSGD